MAKGTTSNLHIRRRLLVIFFLLAFLLVALVFRLGWVQFVMAEELQQKAWEQWNRSIPTRSSRGSIYDRNGNLLAGSATVETVMALPSQVTDPYFTAKALAPVLEMDEDRIYELITQERAAVYVKRKVDEETAKEVRLLNLPGITLLMKRRDLSQWKLLSQLLGFVGTDQVGPG